METKRSSQVNKSMHVLFENISSELLARGIGRKMIMQAMKDYDAPVTEKYIKQEVWGPIMYTMFGKTKTSDLTNKEVSECYDVLNKFVSETFKLECPWPSVESLYANDWYDKN